MLMDSRLLHELRTKTRRRTTAPKSHQTLKSTSYDSIKHLCRLKNGNNIIKIEARTHQIGALMQIDDEFSFLCFNWPSLLLKFFAAIVCVFIRSVLNRCMIVRGWEDCYVNCCEERLRVKNDWFFSVIFSYETFNASVNEWSVYLFIGSNSVTKCTWNSHSNSIVSWRWEIMLAC